MGDEGHLLVKLVLCLEMFESTSQETGGGLGSSSVQGGSDGSEGQVKMKQGHLYGQLAVGSCAAKELQDIAGHVVAIAAHEILNLFVPPPRKRPYIPNVDRTLVSSFATVVVFTTSHDS